MCASSGQPKAQAGHQLIDVVSDNRNDDKTVSESKLEPGTTVHLVLALRGGQSVYNFHSAPAFLGMTDAQGIEQVNLYRPSLCVTSGPFASLLTRRFV